MENEPNINFYFFFKRACTECEHENFVNAIELFSSAIEIYPASAESYLRRGFARLDSTRRKKDGTRGSYYPNLYDDVRSDFNKSLELFNLALKVDNNPKLYLLRGISKIKCDDVLGAIEDFNLSIKKGLKNNSALFNRALAYASIDKFKNAIEDFSKVINIDPTDMSAYLRRASCKHYLNDFGGANEDLTKVENISLDSDKEVSQKCLSFIYRLS